MQPKRYMRLLVVLAAALMLWPNPTQAQESATPIQLGDTQLGELSNVTPQPRYALTLQQAQTIVIEVRGITPDLAPSFSIFTPQGELWRVVGNPNTADRIRASVLLDPAGQYEIQVTSVSGVFGEFALTINSADEDSPPTQLTPDSALNGELPSGGAVRFTFRTNTETLSSLQLGGAAGTRSVSVEIRDTQGRLIVNLAPDVFGGTLTFPPRLEEYIITLRNDIIESPPISYEISLTQSPRTASDDADAPPNDFVLPAIPADGPCSLAPSANNRVNLRAGPNTEAEVLGSIFPNQTYEILGQNNAGEWFFVESNGTEGWVAGFVVRLGGQGCAEVPVRAGQGGNDDTTPDPVPPNSNY